MSNLAIIVPAFGPQSDLDNTLLSILENRPAACDVLVPHPPGYSDPYDLSDEVEFIDARSENLAELLNTAIEATTADVVHLLMPGTLATPAWTDAAMERFASNDELMAIAPLVSRADREDRVACLGIAFSGAGRKRWLGAGSRVAKHVKQQRAAKPIAGPALMAGFYRRDAFVTVGGFHPQYSSFWLDVEWSQRCAAHSLQCVSEVGSRVLGELPTKSVTFATSRQAERLYWQQPGAWAPLQLLLHVAWSCSESVGQIPSLQSITSMFGRGIGFCSTQAGRGGQPLAITAATHATTLSLEEAQQARERQRGTQPTTSYRAAG